MDTGLRVFDHYHFKTVHRLKHSIETQTALVEGLTTGKEHCAPGKNIETLPEVSKGFSFMTQKDNEELPTVLDFNKPGRIKPNHPDLAIAARVQFPVLYILRKKSNQTPTDNQSNDTIPWNPNVHGGHDSDA